MKYTVAAGFTLLAILAWMLPKKADEHTPEVGAAISENDSYHTSCAVCHGDRGQGNDVIGAPSIASLPRWYTEKQIENFRTGVRGGHPDDMTGQQMRGATLNLTKKQIVDALDAIESFPVVVHSRTLQGDVKRGADLYRENCMECHRFNGRGELAFGSSQIAGMQDWYILAQWKKFEVGTRGYDPRDEGGAKMRKAVQYLPKEKDLKDVIAYISTLAEKYPSDKNIKLPTR